MAWGQNQRGFQGALPTDSSACIVLDMVVIFSGEIRQIIGIYDKLDVE
jgi:hypothetical protein